MKKHIFAVHEKMKDNNCSCKEKDKCPLKNECEVESNGIVYEAEVTSFSNENEPVKVCKYIGGTSLKFKQRFYVHSFSFKKNKQKGSTVLSKYIRQLENSNIKYKISWTIKSKCKIFNSTAKCDICETEKKIIDKTDSEVLLNETNKIKCMHKKR